MPTGSTVLARPDVEFEMEYNMEVHAELAALLAGGGEEMSQLEREQNDKEMLVSDEVDATEANKENVPDNRSVVKPK